MDSDKMRLVDDALIEAFDVVIDIMEPDIVKDRERRCISTNTLRTNDVKAAMDTALLIHEHGPANQRLQVRNVKNNKLLLNLSARDEDVAPKGKRPNGG